MNLRMNVATKHARATARAVTRRAASAVSATTSVFMAMMDIRVMRMTVSKRRVMVTVGMRLDAVPVEVMIVPMVCVVAVCMRVCHRQVSVFMRMCFSPVQPETEGHERCGDPEQGTRHLA